MHSRLRKVGAALGVAAPVGFISTWVSAGAITPGYSHISEHISRLAASGAKTHVEMNSGFVGYAAVTPLFAYVLKDELSLPVAAAVLASAIGTAGLAALPLDVSSTVDSSHAVAAAIAYLGLTLAPILAYGPLRKRGHSNLAKASVATGVLAGLSFGLSFLGPAHGLFQRGGITTVDAWMIAVGIAMLLKPPQTTAV